jgi:hypothetical protein
MKLKGILASIVAVGVLALVTPVHSQAPAAPPAGEMKEDKGAKEEMKKEKKQKKSKKHKKAEGEKAKDGEGMKGEGAK